MIVVRNLFRAKFGQAKEVTALFKQLIAISQTVGFEAGKIRLLTDLAGEPFYTFVLETTHDSLAHWEKSSQSVRGNAEWPPSTNSSPRSSRKATGKCTPSSCDLYIAPGLPGVAARNHNPIPVWGGFRLADSPRSVTPGKPGAIYH